MRKKTLLFTLLYALFAFQAFAQSPKMVMIEESTQASCGPCAEQNPDFDALLAANADNVVVLKYQTAWPGFDQMNLDNPTEVQDRVDYYAIQGVPTGIINGIYIANDCNFYDGAPSCLSQAEIDAAYTSTAAFDLDINGEFENNAITISGTLTANEAVSGDLRLRIAITEQTIDVADVPGGSNGETEFHHVFKRFVGGSEGIDLEDTWLQGDSYVINQSFDLSGTNIYNYDRLEIVAFVQDDDTKNVYQAAKDRDIALNVTAENDVSIIELTAPLSFCPGE